MVNQPIAGFSLRKPNLQQLQANLNPPVVVDMRLIAYLLRDETNNQSNPKLNYGLNARLYKNKYRTDSIRLKGWDYRSPGRYFITICTQNRYQFFGQIRNGIMGLSRMGLVANWFWLQIPDQFPHVILDEYIVMPNHVHGILCIVDDDGNGCRDAINRVSTMATAHDNTPINDRNHSRGGATGNHNPMLTDGNLGRIIRWYKGRCSYEIHQRNYPDFQWQGRFWDHIIRDKQSLQHIRNYIHDNSLR
jgi:REP element-mobilizing transposase RayT